MRAPGFEPFQSVWWAFNTHIHTVYPSKFGSIEKVTVQRIEISTPDDDFLELDVMDMSNGHPIVALFHGLEGSSERFYIRNLMFQLQVEGFSSVALNFRGCGHKINRQRKMYHSGATSDYNVLYNWMKEEYPLRSKYAVGFSLGGNALIKSLGESGENHPIQKAVTVSAPYDLKKGSLNLQHGVNQLYQPYFLKSLKNKAAKKREQYPDVPVFNGKTLYDFDDQITAPLHGFKNADHYYDTCSSGQFISKVKKPLLLIHSKQDTICPLEYAPFEDLETNPYIETIFTEKGGHVGFVGKPKNWLNRSIVEWLKS
ncbi:MAG: alpha/beta fold hydrolase [Balneolales bacterium]|nr:alpha/beta fold hydrolase [Balneolales bacterium]